MTGGAQFGLTRKALEAKAFIRQYVRENRFAPSLDDIGTGVGVKKARVHVLICQLEERGHLRCIRDRNGRMRKRTMVVIDEPSGNVCHHCGYAFGSPECLARASITYSNTPPSQTVWPTAEEANPLSSPSAVGAHSELERT
jgi:hypothetical protein